MYRIALVVDESFGSKVIELARTVYVWLVESVENNRWAKLTWQATQEGGDPLHHGLSTFKRQDGEGTDAMVIRLLDMIDEHHGEFSHDPEWSDIDVIGAYPSSAIVDAASGYGVERCEVIPGGFRLSRPHSNVEPDSPTG